MNSAATKLPERPLDRPLRILVATNVYPPRFVGGAELMAHKLALALAQRGHDVRVFAGDLEGPIVRGKRLDDTLDGLTVHRVGLEPRDFDPAWQNLVNTDVDSHLAAVLREFRPDIIHAHNLMGLSIRLPAIAADLGIPTVVTLHDFWGICLRNTLMRPDDRLCHDTTACRTCLPANREPRAINFPMRLRKDTIELALASVARFVSPSRLLADRYLAWGLPPERMRVIPNGIDGASFAPATNSPSGPLRILYVGYLGAHKGVAGLITAVAAMQNRSQVHLTLVGIGPEEAALRNQAARAGLGEITFAGRIAPQDMPRVYAEADILVLPSVWAENQPVSIMEGMASGLAVVASRIGGVPELIEDRVTGRLYEAGNASMLASALDELVTNTALRLELGRNARRHVASQTFERQAERMEAIFGDVLTGEALLPTPKPITAIVGDCRGRTDDPDFTDLPSQVLERTLMVPGDWLTEGQIRQCAGLRHYRTEGGRWRALGYLKAFALDQIWPILPAKARLRILARGLHNWPNFADRET